MKKLILGLSICPLVLSSVSMAATKSATPTDPQIAHIVVTADKVDINAGKLAMEKSQNKEVKDFAQTMVNDHTAVNKKATELANKLHMTPEDNATSKTLMKSGDENLSKLKSLTGKDFDRAYVDHEVAYHQSVLDAIDNTLLPNAKNPELKALIEKVRPAIASHLEHAKHMQTSIH